MINSDFEPPSKKLSFLATFGGVITAVIAIIGFNSLSKYLIINTDSISKLNTKLTIVAGKPIAATELTTTQEPYIAPGSGTLTTEETAMARQAWLYFQRNWNDKTGLVNSVNNFASVTMWDQAAAMAALVSAKELDIITVEEFESKMIQMLKTLASMPLYKGELPNKVYNSKTLVPVNYGQLDKREEIGWSALDLGRLAIWLNIVGIKYPKNATTNRSRLETLANQALGQKRANVRYFCYFW